MKNVFLFALGIAGLPFTQAGINVVVSSMLNFTVTCETSGGSPLLDDVYDVADQVHTGPEDECYQNNPYDSHCTKLEQNDGAKISICDYDEGGEIGCQQVADMTRALADNCSNGERAGGYIEEWKLMIDGWEKTPAWIEIT